MDWTKSIVVELETGEVEQETEEEMEARIDAEEDSFEDFSSSSDHNE